MKQGIQRRIARIGVLRCPIAPVLTLALGLLLAALAAHAQPARKVARVGWIAPTTVYLEAFRQGMRERGWVEGENLVIEDRWGDRNSARDLAAELVRLQVDVIVTGGPMAFGARAEAGVIPVVFGFSGDPVEAKLVASLAHPGRSLTGMTFLGFELVGKRLELLKEALPGLSRVASWLTRRTRESRPSCGSRRPPPSGLV